VRRAALVAIAVLALTACGSRQPAKSVVRSHDCFDAWNAEGNEANRADLVTRGFAIGRVSRGRMIADPAAGGQSRETKLCGYLFHNDKRFTSYTGDWRGDELRWTNSAALRGTWTAVQQNAQVDDVRVLGDGRIAKR
jgi:hypothetical protein